MKDMFKEIIKEMTTTTKDNEYDNQIERNNDNISYEEEIDDADIEILSSDDDTDPYTDQKPTNERSSLRAHKNMTSSKRKKISSRRSKRSK